MKIWTEPRQANLEVLWMSNKARVEPWLGNSYNFMRR